MRQQEYNSLHHFGACKDLQAMLDVGRMNKFFRSQESEPKVPFTNPIIQREIAMECLSCGKSISDEIISRRFRLHLCTECRIELMNDTMQGWIAKMERKK